MSVFAVPTTKHCVSQSVERLVLKQVVFLRPSHCIFLPVTMSFHRYTSLPLLVLGLTLGNALPIYSSTSTACPDPIADTLNGSYFGVHNSDFKQDFFLGVPFAQPPVGDLRLRQPASLNSTWTGVKNATEYGFACIGYGEDTQIGGHNYVDEDCLTLNIVTPSGWNPSQKLPVAVWIYGLVN